MKKRIEKFRLHPSRRPKAFISVNPTRENVQSCAEKVIARLLGIGVTPYLDAALESLFPGTGAGFLPPETALPESDIMIVIGGDGTILRAARSAILCDVPILGINAGRLGFLSDLEREEIPLLEKLVRGGCRVERRMMLDVVHGSEVETAVNDVFLSKIEPGKIVDLDVRCDGREVAHYRADGIVFATPNGSTAYSMSAGGPVLDSGLDAIIMTPICPHSLISRSIVCSGDKILTIRAVCSDSEKELGLVVDGEKRMVLQSDDEISVRRSEKYIRFVNITGRGFYEILNEKMIGRR